MIVKIDNDQYAHKKISVEWPTDQSGVEFTIHDFIKTLSAAEQDTWNRINLEHEEMVQHAVSVGDAWIIESGVQVEIFWKSPEIHDTHLATIPRENTRRYVEFWNQFEDYCKKQI